MCLRCLGLHQVNDISSSECNRSAVVKASAYTSSTCRNRLHCTSSHFSRITRFWWHFSVFIYLNVIMKAGWKEDVEMWSCVSAQRLH